jgi:hypothetical protein
MRKQVPQGRTLGAGRLIEIELARADSIENPEHCNGLGDRGKSPYDI